MIANCKGLVSCLQFVQSVFPEVYQRDQAHQVKYDDSELSLQDVKQSYCFSSKLLFFDLLLQSLLCGSLYFWKPGFKESSLEAAECTWISWEWWIYLLFKMRLQNKNFLNIILRKLPTK